MGKNIKITKQQFETIVENVITNDELDETHLESEPFTDYSSKEQEKLAHGEEHKVKNYKNPHLNEEDDEDIVTNDKLPVDDIDFELDDSMVDDLLSGNGPNRRFRGSIYLDGVVPETDDKEYDRKLALKLMEYYRKQISTMETYVGGVGFKQRSITNPFDNMDF